MALTELSNEVVQVSGQLNNWTLAVFAGSVATIISTSYVRPKSLRSRLVYLLFLPGWCCLAMSARQGEQITNRWLASMVATPARMKDIGSIINDLYASQSQFLYYALALFGIWLALFLVLWIFTDELTPKRGD